MRFLLDNDIDAAVGHMLRRRGHQCWTASAVGLAAAADDALTVWATSHNAILVSTDREFGQRRMRNAVGHHLWLRCPTGGLAKFSALISMKSPTGSRRGAT